MRKRKRKRYDDETRQCPECNGDGYIDGEVCLECLGSGIVESDDVYSMDDE